MASYKHYDYAQTKMLPVRFEEQILPGTFEYTLNRLIDERFDLEVFDGHYKNDRPVLPPTTQRFCSRSSSARTLEG